MPTTLAEAPIGVALPPISVPIASVHERTESSAPVVAESVFITGIIVAANGILSINALAIADTQMIIAIITIIFPPLTFPMNCANISRIPVCSSPPTTKKRPIKKSNVL